MSILNTLQRLFDFKKFDWFGGHWLPAHILVIDKKMENARKTQILRGKIEMAESENSRFASVAEVNK